MSHVGLDFIAAQRSHGKKYEQHLKHNFKFYYTCPFPPLHLTFGPVYGYAVYCLLIVLIQH